MSRCATAAFVLFAVSLNAQSTPDATTARPERPTVATHAVAVAPGYVELEAGAATTRRSGAADHAMIVVAKFGLAERLQLTVASSVTRTAARVASAEPVYAGVKWQAGTLRAGRPLFAVMPGVTIANGPRRERDAARSGGASNSGARRTATPRRPRMCSALSATRYDRGSCSTPDSRHR